MKSSSNSTLERQLADPYAFALLQWPATLSLLGLESGGWWLVLKVVLGLWLALMFLAAYAGRRPGRVTFGNAMLLSNVAVALGGWLHPAGWAWLFAALALLLLYTGQRALFRGAGGRESEPASE